MKGHFYISNKIIDDGYLKLLSGNDLKVLIKIARHYDKHGTCFPSIRKMAIDLNLHHETIGNSLRHLKELGFIDILEIKQRYKLRYIFSNSARFLLLNPNNVVGKADTKDIKDLYKEKINYLEKKPRTQEEQKHIDESLAQVRNNLEKKGIIIKQNLQ